MNGHTFRMFYEDYARCKLAEHLGVDVDKIIHLNKINAVSPYDLQHKETKFDVKFSSPCVVVKNRSAIWDFSLRKRHSGKRCGQKQECDFFLLVGMKNAIPQSIYLISSDCCPTNHIRIPLTKNSKYEKYLIF